MAETLISKKIIDEIKKSIGHKKVFTDKPTRVCYTITHGPEFLLHEKYFDDFLPEVIVKPGCVKDVQSVVRIARDYKIPLIPSGGRSGCYGAEGMNGSIIVDMCDMDKILDINERTYRVTGEAGVRMIDMVSFLNKKGYMAIDWPDSDEIATLGARAAINGYNWWENRWGSAGNIIQGLEVVLPDGELVQLGRGSSKPTKSSTGWNLMDLFIGSRGSLGIITKVTEKFTDYPSKIISGGSAFSSFEDAIKAYLELKKSKYSNTLWRFLCSVSQKMTFPVISGKKWPEKIKMMLDYQLFGEEYEVEGADKKIKEILKENNGFTMPEVSELDSWFDSNANEWKGIKGKTTNIMMGFESHLLSGKIDPKGYSARCVYLDPNIPDSHLLNYYHELQEFLNIIEDGKTYPNLANCVKVFDSGAIIPGIRGTNKMWIVLHVFRKNMNDKSRKEFVDMFRKHTEIIWRNSGVISNTHAYIPRELEVEFMKKTMGENGYKLMKSIKKTIDPNNIMNPKVFF